MPKESIQNAQEAFNTIRQLRLSTFNTMTRRRADFAAGCSATLVLSAAEFCGSVITAMDAAAATPGLVAYARQMYGDAVYDMATEYQALRAALVALRGTASPPAGVIGLFPQDASGFLLYQKLLADGSLNVRTFSAAQLAPLVALTDAVLAALP